MNLGIPLLVGLIGSFIAQALLTKEYDRRGRLFLLAVTFVSPAVFYLFWI